MYNMLPKYDPYSNIKALKFYLLKIYFRYLSLSLDPQEISEQNSPWVVYDMASNPAGRDVAWDFLKDNWSYYQG